MFESPQDHRERRERQIHAGQRAAGKSRSTPPARTPVERFYADQVLPHLPADLTLSTISRTVDRWRLVDETTVSFTHDRELPWLLPGVKPTFRRAQVLAIAVVGFDRTRIRSQRVLWDHATLLGQLDITAPAATGPAR